MDRTILALKLNHSTLTLNILKREITVLWDNLQSTIGKHNCHIGTNTTPPPPLNIAVEYVDYVHIVCSNATVVPTNWLELSPSLKNNSLDISISPMFKLVYLTLFSELFTLYSSVFLLKIQITECFKEIVKILD